MSRLPGPGEGWTESTEGDLDPDLTDEAGSRLEDWDDPFEEGTTWRRGGLRLVALLMLVVIVVFVVARALA
jgi:hypothetical protein